jgi:hypothetical protein
MLLSLSHEVLNPILADFPAVYVSVCRNPEAPHHNRACNDQQTKAPNRKEKRKRE